MPELTDLIIRYITNEGAHDVGVLSGHNVPAQAVHNRQTRVCIHGQMQLHRRRPPLFLLYWLSRGSCLLCRSMCYPGVMYLREQGGTLCLPRHHVGHGAQEQVV